ncbi:MAG: response regulator [Actinomycetota bacterium]|nr:response regulator [Actinomycetota bacterium]
MEVRAVFRARTAGMRTDPEHARMDERPPADWLTLGQAARYLGVAQSTVRKWSDSGRLPAFYTPGGHRRFRRGDLDAFLGSARAGAPGAARPLILIVDDDAGLREYLRANLEPEGFLVREAENAETGLAALEDEPPDLVLLDVMMPGMDGWEMLRRVQERHGVGAVPVIMFSGKVDAGGAAEAEARGAEAFIGKPFDPQQLLASTKQLLRS